MSNSSSTDHDCVNCQEDCPFVMPCGDCFACSQYPECEDKPSTKVCEQCKKCFNDEEFKK